MRPTGLRSFALTPQLPADWTEMKLKSIQSFRQSFDLAVRRRGAKLEIEVKPRGGKTQVLLIAPGETTNIRFD